MNIFWLYNIGKLHVLTLAGKCGLYSSLFIVYVFERTSAHLVLLVIEMFSNNINISYVYALLSDIRGL